VHEKRPADFESTTSVLARRAPGFVWLPIWLRKHLSPTSVGSAIAALVAAVVYVVNAQQALHLAQAEVRRHEQRIAALESEKNILNEIKTQVAVLNSKVDTIAAEVDRQRTWRERIENVAELPPHPRRH
jgi:hypothetical protein